MYQLFNLGLVIGTKIGFAWWCLLTIAAVSIIGFKRSRLITRQMIRRAIIQTEIVFKTSLPLRIASGNQGLPIQLEIFEQNLATRIRTFLRQVGNLPKVRH